DEQHPSSNNALMGFNSGTNRFYYNDALSRPTNPARYRPDTVIGNNTGLKGRWAYRLDTNLAVTTNPKRKCMDWYRNELALPSISRFTTCPCSLWQGQFDMSYINGDISRYGYQPPNVTDRFGGGVRCHYNKFGALVSGSYESAPEEALFPANETEPYRSCCQSGDARFCRLYQQKRPPNQCAFYRPPFAAFLIGDPHITTLDNVSYTFNGLGEYTVLEAVGDGVNFTMQGRTGIARTNASTNISSKATSFIAIVAQETGGIKVEWILKNSSIVVLVDGKQINSTDDDSGQGGIDAIYNQTMSINWSDGHVVATFASGISLNVSSVSGALNFITSLQESFINRTKGLLGVFNKDPTDDFQASNGTVLRFNGSNVPPESQIYYSFGITCNYNATSGETWSTFNNNSFVPTFYEELINQTSAKQLADIQELCGGQFDCIFDMLSTGDSTFALATSQSAMEFGSQQKALQNFPPNITSDGQISTMLNQVVTVKISAVDSNNDTIVFTISRNSSDLNITVVDTLCWWKLLIMNFSFKSSRMYLNIHICASIVLHKNLPNIKNVIIIQMYILIEYLGQNYVIMVSGCLCDPGYAGVYCTDDYNACVDSPCHPGVNCTDEPAPSLGFSCGPCPVGLTGNGSKCYANAIKICCNGTACIGGFCKNGGTCFNTPQCTAECKCQASYYGIDCQYGKTTINASIKTGLYLAVLQRLLSPNIGCSIAHKSLSSYYLLGPGDWRETFLEMEVLSIDKTGDIGGQSRWTLRNEFDGQGIKDANNFCTLKMIVVILFLLSDLTEQWKNLGMGTPMKVIPLHQIDAVSKDELKQYINCSTTMPKYVPIWIDGTGFVCQSPCITEIYCKNGGQCQHTSKGPVCTCAPNGIYHSDGDQCQHLTVTSPAFFGILFGSLGGMLLLGIGIYAFWRYKLCPAKAHFTFFLQSIQCLQ
uniref:VWFD domain-containing protein n=1 Tax=Petromyzon marinus TaxID=7757 RepID=S4R5G7_PETMA